MDNDFLTKFKIIKNKTNIINEEDCYLLQFDGLSVPNPGESTSGAVIFEKQTRKPIIEIGEYIKYATNNQAEYTGLLIGLQEAAKRGLKNILIEGDSMLVVNQINKSWKINNVLLKEINTKITELFINFDFIAIRHIYRNFNKYADNLTNEIIKDKKSFIRLL